MKIAFSISAAAVALWAMSLAQPAKATLLSGTTVESKFEATGYGVYAGPVYTAVVGTVSPYPDISTEGTFSISYSDTQITILSAGGPTSFGDGYTFNGVVFDDPDIALTGVTIDASTTLAGITSGNLSFTSTEIDVDLSGLGFNAGDQLVLDVSDAQALPEPASLALLGAAIAGFGAARRKRG